MKNNTSKKNIPKKDSDKKLKWNDEVIEQYLDAILKWLLPEWEKDNNGNKKDIHKNNVYYQSFLIENYGFGNNDLLQGLTRYPWLKDKHELIKDIQESKLVNHSLTKSYDGNFAKFVLTNRWKYKSEKNEQTLEVKDFDIRELLKFEDDKTE